MTTSSIDFEARVRFRRQTKISVLVDELVVDGFDRETAESAVRRVHRDVVVRQRIAGLKIIGSGLLTLLGGAFYMMMTAVYRSGTTGMMVPVVVLVVGIGQIGYGIWRLSRE